VRCSLIRPGDAMQVRGPTLEAQGVLVVLG